MQIKDFSDLFMCSSKKGSGGIFSKKLIAESAPDVALLVDGENLSPAYAQRLLSAAKTCGRVIIRRVYGNLNRVTAWTVETGFKAVHSNAGKNSADILLSIEAVDISCRTEIKTFIIASSDGDFVHLAHYLRERGCRVIGVGKGNAAKAFQEACSDYAVLPVLPVQEKPAEIGAVKTVNDLIRKEIVKSGNPEGLEIQKVGPAVFRGCKVKVGSLGSKSWREYLLSQPEIFDCDTKKQGNRVRPLPT